MIPSAPSPPLLVSATAPKPFVPTVYSYDSLGVVIVKSAYAPALPPPAAYLPSPEPFPPPPPPPAPVFVTPLLPSTLLVPPPPNPPPPKADGAPFPAWLELSRGPLFPPQPPLSPTP